MYFTNKTIEEIFNGTMWNNTTRYKYDKEANTYVYEIEAAGKTKDDVSIENLNDVLEITIGDIKYRAILPNDADTDNIKATMMYGLLTVSVPSKNKKSKIEVAGE